MVEMLLEAATRVLIRDGYEGLTTNRVAEEAGASVGSLYQYFSNKTELVAALLDQHTTRMMSALRAEAPRILALPLEAAVRRFVELMIASHRVEPELHRVFVEQLPRIGDFAQIEANLKEGCALVEAFLRGHAAEVAPRDHGLAAFIVVHSVESLTHAAVLSRPQLMDAPEFIDEICAMVGSYLRG